MCRMNECVMGGHEDLYICIDAPGSTSFKYIPQMKENLASGEPVTHSLLEVLVIIY